VDGTADTGVGVFTRENRVTRNKSYRKKGGTKKKFPFITRNANATLYGDFIDFLKFRVVVDRANTVIYPVYIIMYIVICILLLCVPTKVYCIQ